MRRFETRHQIRRCLDVIPPVASGDGQIDERGDLAPFVSLRVPVLQRQPKLLLALGMLPDRGQLDTKPVMCKGDTLRGVRFLECRQRGACRIGRWTMFAHTPLTKLSIKAS